MGDMNQANGESTKKRGLSRIIQTGRTERGRGMENADKKNNCGEPAAIEKKPSLAPLTGFLGKFRLTKIFVIFLAIYSYLFLPLEPKVPTTNDLYEVVGLPEYINTSTTTFSGYAFKVSNYLLNCDQRSLSGAGGCEFFSNAVDKNIPARAIYYWQPTRLWTQYRALYSLEQDGRMIVTPEQMHAWSMRGYQGELEGYYLVMYFIVGLISFISFFEIFGIRIALYIVKKTAEK